MNPQLFSVLSEPNRIRILEFLRTGAKPVNEIVTRLSLNQPQVSKHLKVLSDAGVVAVYPIAQQRYYQLQQKPFKELESWLEKYRGIWNERFDRLDSLLQKQKRR